MAILPPRATAGDAIALRAEIDLIVGLTACSAEMAEQFQVQAYRVRDRVAERDLGGTRLVRVVPDSGSLCALTT
jgi:uncharacterized protein YcgI (DUF1989 family)